MQASEIAAAQRGRIAFRHDQARTLVVDDRLPMPPAGRGDERRSGRQRLEHDVRQAVDVAAVVADGRHADDVGGGEQRADVVLRQIAEEPDARRDARRCARAARSSPARSAVAGDRQHAASRHDGQRVDQILEALLADQPSGREDQRRARAMAELARGASRAPRGSGRNRSTSTPYGTVSMRSRRGAERDRAACEIVAARGDAAGALESRARRGPRRRDASRRR